MILHGMAPKKPPRHTRLPDHMVDAFMDWLQEVHPDLYDLPSLRPVRVWTRLPKKGRVGLSWPSARKSPRSKLESFETLYEHIVDEWFVVQRTVRRLGVKV